LAQDFSLNEYGNIVSEIDYTEVATDKKVKDPQNKYTIYKVVEKNASFKGGIAKMNKYILENLEYPEEFMQSDYQKVTVEV
jgi:predicted nuclease of restriction endonuclease-like (RecB) superfamily